jgi:hypothetical protein
MAFFALYQPKVFPTFHKLFHKPKLKKALQTVVCKAFSGICDYYVKNWGILICFT